MSETLTITDVESTQTPELVSELSAEEQDSLQLGEQIQEQQEQLLAGKYKDAEQLEKAYIELSKKLGQDGKEETKAEGEQEEVLQETPEESTEELSSTAQ